ncbi:DNA polymerase zeta [Tulasnella sp. 427]|nr:DNA polymerase zeta [Tulasnella sp. 427]
MSKPDPLIKVRITNADHAMEPSGTLDNTSLLRVPIIRIYGLSSMGHKTCVHIHQTWPYLYVEYKGSMTPDAVAISLRKNPADVRSKYIRAIHVVKGVHLYGFHCNWTPFLKIYIIDPQQTIRIATILRSGGIMQQKFQVFESHLSYLLQFMCDFGLYGCGELELSDAWVRHKPVDLNSNNDDDDDVDTSMFSVSPYPRLSTMALELDVLAYHILNPLLLAARNIHNALSIPGPPLPSEPLVLSVRELWEDERKRRIAKGLPPTPSMPSSVGTDRSDGPRWRAEQRLRAELLDRIKRDEEAGIEYRPEQSTRAWENHVMTAFESRGSIWPPEHRVWKPVVVNEESPSNSPEVFDPASHGISRTTSKVEEDYEIDEVFLTSQGMDNLLRATTKDDEAVEEDYLEDEDVFDVPDGPSRRIAKEETDRTIARKASADIPDQRQQLSGEASYSTENSSSQPPTKKRKVDHVGLALQGYSRLALQPRYSLEELNFTYPILPPTATEVLDDIVKSGLKEVLHRDPYYSNPKDVPNRSRVYAGRLFMLKGGTGVGSLSDWDAAELYPESQFPDSPSKKTGGNDKPTRKPLRGRGVSGWEYARGACPGPPGRKEIERWLEETDGSLKVADNRSRRKVTMQSQASAAYFNSKGTRLTQNYVTQNRQPQGGGRESQNMSVLSIEVFAVSRGSLLPNPEFDRVECILYALQEQDVVITDPTQRRASYIGGCVAVDSEALQSNRMRDPRIELYETELDLINALIDRVKEWDPDVLTGWEIQTGVGDTSQKDLIENTVGRLISLSSRGPGNVKYDSEHTSTLHVSGRHVLNAWRIMRVEQSLTSYSMENVVFHILHRRVPHYSAGTLSQWFKSKAAGQTARVLDYFIERAAMVLDVLDETVFGVEFFSVLSRGSQFKVESFVFRIAKPESLMLLSPSREDVGRQNAAECIPLIMEPKSAYYKSPLVVLDFQSLYPSIMIAYNYCYTTCLGRVGTLMGSRIRSMLLANSVKFRVVPEKTGNAEHVYPGRNTCPSSLNPFASSPPKNREQCELWT